MWRVGVAISRNRDVPERVPAVPDVQVAGETVWDEESRRDARHREERHAHAKREDQWNIGPAGTLTESAIPARRVDTRRLGPRPVGLRRVRQVAPWRRRLAAQVVGRVVAWLFWWRLFDWW